MKIVDANTDLCSKHLEAYGKIKDAYSLWFSAYGKLTTDDFLKRLVELPETGDRARRVARFLLHAPERWK